MKAAPSGGENLEWWYLDSTEKEFGPFRGETMREWFKQGFFPIGENLLVRLQGWEHHTQLRNVYPDVNEAFVGPPRDPRGSLGSPQHAMQDSFAQAAYCGGPGGGPWAMYGADGHAGGGPQPLPQEEVSSPYAAAQQFGGAFWMMPQGCSGCGGAGGCGGWRGCGYAAAGSGVGFAPPPFPQANYGSPQPRHPGGYGNYVAGQRFQGRIKSFNAKQGFGFIECPEAHAIFGRDIFLHKMQIGDLKVHAEVMFSVETNKTGMPQARDLTTLDGQKPGPAPASVAKGGTGGVSSGGGGGCPGRGKGGGRGGGGGKQRRSPGGSGKGKGGEEQLGGVPG